MSFLSAEKRPGLPASSRAGGGLPSLFGSGGVFSNDTDVTQGVTTDEGASAMPSKIRFLGGATTGTAAHSPAGGGGGTTNPAGVVPQFGDGKAVMRSSGRAYVGHAVHQHQKLQGQNTLPGSISRVGVLPRSVGTK